MNLSTAQKVVRACIKHRVYVPLILVGHTSAGKTQTFRDIAAEYKMPLSALRIGSMENVGDLLGMPYVNSAGETVYGIPEWFKIVQDGGILLLDEVTRARRVMIDAVMQLLDERRFGCYTLPPTTLIFGISNPMPSDTDTPMGPMYDVQSVDAAVIERCCFIRVDPPTQQEGLSYIIERKYHPRVIDFVAMSEGALYSGGDVNLPQKLYTFRGVAQINQLMPVIEDVPEAETELVLGCVGPTGLTIWKNQEILKQVPTAEEYFKNPDKYKISDMSNLHLMVFLTRVIGFLRSKSATDNICNTFTKLCADLNEQMLMYVARICADKHTEWVKKFIRMDNKKLMEAAEKLVAVLSGMI